jgi:hypothetical protein
MVSGGAPPDMGPRLRVMRIVHGALLMGCATFAVIAIYLRQQGDMPTPAQPVVSFAGLAFGGAILVAVVVVPNVLAGGWRKKVAAGQNPLSSFAGRPAGMLSPRDEALWWTLYQTRLIIMAALLEGTVFFNLVAYLTEGRDWSLAVAGLFMLLLALLIPTRSRVAGWVRLQQELVEQQRSGV